MEVNTFINTDCILSPTLRPGTEAGGSKHLPLNLEKLHFFSHLLVREVSHVRVYLYPVSGKLTQLFFRKKTSVGVRHLP